MPFHRFEDIEAWQEASNLTKLVYDSTETWKDFALRDQTRQASVSVIANIAEGIRRATTGDCARFLDIAQGSALETASHLYVALDLEYLDRTTFDELYGLATTLNKTIGALAKYLKQSKSRPRSSSRRPATSD